MLAPLGMRDNEIFMFYQICATGPAASTKININLAFVCKPVLSICSNYVVALPVNAKRMATLEIFNILYKNNILNWSIFCNELCPVHTIG